MAPSAGSRSPAPCVPAPSCSASTNPPPASTRGESDELAGLLQTIKADGTTILLIEHDMGVVMRISDHIVVLDHGEKISEGPPDQVRADPAVIAAYLGEDEAEVAAA